MAGAADRSEVAERSGKDLLSDAPAEVQNGWENSRLSSQRQLQARAISSKRMLEVLVKKEEAVFEERRLQDLLLCRTQAPDCDLQALWERRRGELLDRRQLHQQVSHG